MATCGGPEEKGERHFRDTCLVDAFRSVGIKVPYTRDGPLWATADGMKLLAPFGYLGGRAKQEASSCKMCVCSCLCSKTGFEEYACNLKGICWKSWR